MKAKEEFKVSSEIKVISIDAKKTKDKRPYLVVYAEIIIEGRIFVRKFYVF